MAKTKAVTDEQIIAALLQHGTIEKAAAAVGISTRTVYDRMREREFKGLYAHAKADVLRAAVNNMTAQLSVAINEIADIMQDKSANPAIRLQAAQTILNNAGKYWDVLQAAEKTANKDSTPPDEALANMFDMLA